jgi:[ribosomal protein S18]-alanine N-acetyltransferase
LSLRVRPATVADVDAMMALASHAVTASQWPRDRYLDLFASGSRRKAWVIEENAAVRGFLAAGATEEEWEIENLAIAVAARRQGLGTRLLGEFVDTARREGAKRVFLEVRESNRAARALYAKWGFVETGRRRLYYRDPDEDAVLYQLSFL